MSTNINLTYLISKIGELKKLNAKPLVLFIDLKGAYDNVNHQ